MNPFKITDNVQDPIEEKNPKHPRVGLSGGSTFLWVLGAALATGAGVWWVMRSQGAPMKAPAFWPVKNLQTGDVACLPETATVSIFEGGSAA